MNKKIIKTIIGITSALVFSFIVYIGAYSFTYKVPIFSTASDTGAVGQLLRDVTNQPEVSADVLAQAQDKGITLETLAQYNGKNGQPAYVAFEGVVYDVSAVADWKKGSHHGVQAGTDITEVFSKSPHSQTIFKLAVVVGDLES